MKSVLLSALPFLFPMTVGAGEKLQWVKMPELSYSDKTRKWHVTFETNTLCDVEVAIVDPSSSTVIRHLAAGVLGPKAPPPLIRNSRFQKLEWDGRDDYGLQVVNPKKCVVRARAGMTVELEQIVGGNPYAYHSREMGDSDHSPWGINGLEAKSDGKVYVWGHSSNLGPPALRQYDSNGNYLQTLFPMPAGEQISAMKGWGINVKPDGTYVPKFNLLVDPSLTTTFLDTNLRMARLFPTLDRERLTFWQSGLQADSFELMTMQTDGTIAQKPEERLLGPLVKNPPFVLKPIEPNSHVRHSLLGPAFTCFAPDGKSFYLSGLYAGKTRYGSVLEIAKDGFWRDGQVWKVDAQSRTAKPFFALDAKSIPTTSKERVKAYGGGSTYAALHGVAVDKDGNVFVCDRLNKRLIVLDKEGKILRQIPVTHPDALVINQRTGALYLTTREGDYHRRGTVKLLRFDDWRKDDNPSSAIEVSKTGFTRQHTRSWLAVSETEQGSNVWVAFTQMPVRVYRDDAKGLRLLKDFDQLAQSQRCLGFDRMQVDQKTEEVYLMDAHDSVWKISDWRKPKFVKVPLQTASIAIDSRNRHIYARTLRDGSSSNSVGKVARHHLDREGYPPANYGKTGTNRVTEKLHYEWCFEGNSDKGLAVAPNGNLAVVGKAKDGLRFFAGDPKQVPWKAITIAKLPNNAGGARFDFSGNLYVGFVDSKPTNVLPGFKGERYSQAMGRIHKYAPTGTLASGNLFPKAPVGPTHTYDVPYGAFETRCVTRSPRFGVDGYGRIYYPTNIVPRVTVIDNEGNEILRFGTYGNRDSMGELKGDLVPTKDVPLAFPNSVDATDDYVYVADMVNLRLLRLKKKFRMEARSQ